MEMHNKTINPKRILLVEDDFIIAAIEAKNLKEKGYHVTHVDKGEDAIKYCDVRINDINLILMDIDLGSGIDGTIAAREILKKHNIPLIFVSSHTEQGIVEKTEEITNYGYVVKNSSITVLDASIKMAFKLFEMNQRVIAAKDKLEATLDALPDLFFEVGLDGQYFDFHSPRNDLLYTPANNIVGKRIQEVLPPYVAEVVISAILEANDKGFSVGKQFELDVPAGTLWFELSISRKSGDNSDNPHFIVLSRDISIRKNAENKIQRVSQLYAALSHCNEAINHCKNEEELFSQICQDAVEFGGMKMAWIGIVDEKTQMVLPVASFGDKKGYLKNIEISVNPDNPLSLGPTGTAIRMNQPFWSQDFFNDAGTTNWRDRAAQSGWLSSASLPIQRSRVVIGSLNVYSSELNAFDEDIQKLLLEMTRNINFALDNYANESARKQIELELADKDRFAKTVTDYIPAMIGYWTKDLICTFANPAYLDWFKLTPEQLMGIRMKDLLSEDLYQKNQPNVHAVLSGKNQKFERTVKKENGQIVHLLVQYIPDRVEEFVNGFYVVITDITEVGGLFDTEITEEP